VPKGDLNVNVQRGVVQLRGAVPTQEMLDALVERTRAVQGVLEVESLLHLPSDPAPMHQ
jgi:osmotically-inducible protein OsmY